MQLLGPLFHSLNELRKSINEQAKEAIVEFLKTMPDQTADLVESHAYTLTETFDNWVEESIYGVRLKYDDTIFFSTYTQYGDDLKEVPDWSEGHEFSEFDHYFNVNWLSVLESLYILYDKRYMHLGSFSQVGDIRELGGKPADDIVKYWKSGAGRFDESDNANDPDTDLVESEEADAIYKGAVRFTKDKEFAVADGSYSGWAEEFKDNEGGDDSGVYIDIYRLRK